MSTEPQPPAVPENDRLYYVMLVTEPTEYFDTESEAREFVADIFTGVMKMYKGRVPPGLVEALPHYEVGYCVPLARGAMLAGAPTLVDTPVEPKVEFSTFDPNAPAGPDALRVFVEVRLPPVEKLRAYLLSRGWRWESAPRNRCWMPDTSFVIELPCHGFDANWAATALAVLSRFESRDKIAIYTDIMCAR